MTGFFAAEIGLAIAARLVQNVMLYSVKKEGSKMKNNLSDQIRRLAKERYVDPAVRAGQKEFSIPVRELLVLLPAEFQKNRIPQVCNAIQTAKFLNQDDLQITRVEGPPSGLSTTVVVHYGVGGRSSSTSRQPERTAELSRVDAEERAKRLANAMKGLLSKELAEYGGADAFVRWVRSDDKEAA
ncbi:MAG TPA: hypothetical protein VHZ52_15550 [Acidobacteriaceae bacterium]|nr:hypothetical protein [Acidobacteriaceae bacterium]